MTDEWVLMICVMGSISDLNIKIGRLTAITKFSRDYTPSILVDICTTRITLDDQSIKLLLVIIPGDEYLALFDKSHRLSFYKGAFSSLILFDKGNRESFERVVEWCDEFRHVVGKDKHVVILGILTNAVEVATEEGQQLAEKLKAGYYESTIDDKEKITQILSNLVMLFVEGQGEYE